MATPTKKEARRYSLISKATVVVPMITVLITLWLVSMGNNIPDVYFLEKDSGAIIEYNLIEDPNDYIEITNNRLIFRYDANTILEINDVVITESDFQYKPSDLYTKSIIRINNEFYKINFSTLTMEQAKLTELFYSVGISGTFNISFSVIIVLITVIIIAVCVIKKANPFGRYWRYTIIPPTILSLLIIWAIYIIAEIVLIVLLTFLASWIAYCIEHYIYCKKHGLPLYRREQVEVVVRKE